MTADKQHRVNEVIRVREVRLIGSDGSQLGIMATEDARRLAEEEGLDLVEVAPNAKPPVCRVMDYGKFKYKQSKRVHEAKKKQKLLQLKEMKMRPKTEEHDYQFKIKHVRRFLSEGNKAKITIMFRGRELSHMELGSRILDRLVVDLSDISIVEQQPKREGRNLTMVLAPKEISGAEKDENA
jgi:translation initiation factor IF-3